MTLAELRLEPDTVTCIGIGPVPSERIDPIVKDLNCYNDILQLEQIENFG